MSAGSIYGPMLLGVFLNCILYGVTVVQSYLYYQTCRSDRWWMKIFVSYLLVCETLNTVCDVGVVYEPLIIRYGSTQVLQFAPIMLSASPMMTVMISLPVQLFIAWRVKVMSKSLILPVIITIFAIASFIGGVVTSVLLISIDFQYSRFAANDGAVGAWLTSSAAADLFITASLVYSLMHKRTGFAVTDGIINGIIRVTVQTGSVTSLSALLDLMLFMLLKGETWNFIWDFSLSKLYTNSLLCTLNARGGWKHTTSARNNVLFGNEESMARSHSQMEIVSELRTPRMAPMKVFEAAASGYHQEGSMMTMDVAEYGEAL